MADIRRTLGKFTSPSGRLIAPLYLNEPDGKFDDSPNKLKYKAALLITGSEAAQFLAKVEAAWEDWSEIVKAATGKAVKTAKKNIQWFTKDTPRWDDMGASTTTLLDSLAEGDLVIKTSMKAVMMRDGQESSRTPLLFDSSAELMQNPPPIGFGTVAQINGSFYGWTNAGKASLSLIMNAVQILELVEPGAGGGERAADFGFEATDGGYTHEAETFATSPDGDF